MKNTKRIVTFLLALVMVFTMAAVPTDAKVIKYSDTNTGKSVAKTMTKNLCDASAVILWHNMKYTQTKNYDFHKASARNAILVSLHPTENQELDSSVASRWFFGPTGKKKLNEDAADLGVCSTFYKNLKITRNGSYYKATATVMLHYYYERNNGKKTGYKNIKLGTVTYTYKLRAHSHYGLLLKKASFHRVAKDKYFN